MREKAWQVVVLVFVGMLLLAPVSAKAASLVIDDAATDGVITVTAGDFEFGFAGAGDFPESNAQPQVTFSGSWIVGSSFANFSTDYTLLERVGGPVSDVFHANITFTPDRTGRCLAFPFTGCGNISGYFASDYNGFLDPSLVNPDAQVFIENGQPILFGAPNLSGEVRSDAEVVPEPATLLLLGSGLAGLASWRLLRRCGQK